MQGMHWPISSSPRLDMILQDFNLKIYKNKQPVVSQQSWQQLIPIDKNSSFWIQGLQQVAKIFILNCLCIENPRTG